MGEQISVFVSSAMDELEHEREVAENVISELSLGARLFELIPALSRSPRNAYIEEVRKCQIFTIILWMSFPRVVELEYDEAVERAKPILVFVKDLREAEKRKPELEKFLEGLKGSGETKPSVRTVFCRFRRLSDLKSALRQSLINEIGKFYEVPRVTLTRRELYDLGSDIVANAQKRLYIVQRTPSLFLGSRPYLAAEEEKFAYENAFLKEIKAWILSAENDQKGKKELLYLFSPESTRKELEKTNDVDFSAEVAKHIAFYKDIERKSGSRLRFVPIKTEFSGPMTVGDNRFALWILGTDMAVSISQENDALASSLARFLEASVQMDISKDKILEELGLRGPS